MQGQCSKKHPNDSGPSSEDDEGTAYRAGSVGLHVVWSDGIIALIRVGSQRYDESKLGDLAESMIATWNGLTSINITPIVRQTLR
jgi:hypothetical protein